MSKCLKFQCRCSVGGSNSGHWIRKGCFRRKSDCQKVLRWICTGCKKSVSQATGTACFGQNKRRANEPIKQLLCSGVSLRRSAKLVGVHRTTVARKLRFLAAEARKSQQKFLQSLRESALAHLQFDDMETFEHTKLKPLSITLAVSPERKILKAIVSKMPAKGPLAAMSRKKYGYRQDQRRKALRTVLESIKDVIEPEALFESDENPHYPGVLFSVFPKANHSTTKGGRGCVVGQGELKKLKWDPLFSLNHTAAMFRANVNRLIRKTWCTTKRPDQLQNHLDLYIDYHNQRLTA